MSSFIVNDTNFADGIVGIELTLAISKETSEILVNILLLFRVFVFLNVDNVSGILTYYYSSSDFFVPKDDEELRGIVFANEIIVAYITVHAI